MPRKGLFDESSFGHCWSSSEPSSSSLSSPFGSEHDSLETQSQDEDFMAELTRQMANYMLEDDDIDEQSRAPVNFSKTPEACGTPAKCSGCKSSTSVYYCDPRFYTPATESTVVKTSAKAQIQPIEIYQLNNQPPVKAQLQLQQRQNKGRGHIGNSLSSPKGSGMRAVFLGGSGSRNGSSGTGVFLPRVIDNQTANPRNKKKAGCSTVLVPAKVLQALELHFNKMDALSESNGSNGYNNHNRQGGMKQERKISQMQNRPASDHQEMQLPEEWTY